MFYMEKWFWDKVRSMSLEEAQWLPDVEQVISDMRSYAEWVKNIYSWAETADERFMVLEIIDFGAPFFDGEAGEPDHYALHRWFGTLDIGNEKRQADFLARAFECGNMTWSEYPLETKWWDIGEREVAQFKRYLDDRVAAGTGLDFDVTPRSKDLPPPEVVLVWYAFLERRAEVLRLVDSLCGDERLRMLRAKAGFSTPQPKLPVADVGQGREKPTSAKTGPSRGHRVSRRKPRR